MNISAIGYGRKGTLDKGCGRLVLKANSEIESKQLKQLADEIQDGNIIFWLQLMWAVRHKKLHYKRIASLDAMVKSVCKQFLSFLQAESSL